MAELTGKSISELTALTSVPDGAAFACRSGNASRSATFGAMRDSMLLRGTSIETGADIDNYQTVGAYYLYLGDGKTVTNWPSTSGGLLYVLAGTTNQYLVQLAIISGNANVPMLIRQWNGTAWSAWKTVLYEGNIAELTNDLKIKEASAANLRLQNTNVTVGDTTKAGYIGNLAFWDSSDSARGLIQTQYTENGQTDLNLYAQDNNGNRNRLQLRVNASGNPVVSVTDASAWRAAIGNERTAATAVKATSDNYTVSDDFYVDRCDAVHSITATVTVGAAPATGWTAIFTGLTGPSHYVYQTVPTNAAEFGRGLNLRLRPNGTLEAARGVADAVYNFTLTYIAS